MMKGGGVLRYFWLVLDRWSSLFFTRWSI